MTQEEKARAYDEALERAIAWRKKYVNFTISEDGTMIQDFNNIFPELKESKESEDERIRNALIRIIRNTTEKELFRLYNIHQVNTISWLEKQGEQKPQGKSALEAIKEEKVDDANKVEPKFKVGDTMRTLQEAKDGWTDGMPFVVSIDSEYYNCNSEKIAIKDQDDYEYPPMNRKQKPADKIEPKFHEGDWLIYENGSIYYVNKVYEHTYELVIDNGDKPRIPHELIDKKARLWTIQDAKAGDVLATDDGNIFVFDGTVEEDKYPFAYYGLTRRRFESYDRRLPFTHNNVHPATKEQRDQLEKAMADAGYTFDFEKKELKKVKQKFAEWGEEDEKIKEAIINALYAGTDHAYENEIDWLKSLRPQSHWKPSDEQVMVLAKASETYCGIDKGVLYSLYNDLKKLIEK